jgi:ribosomal-protein-alanine N-acetyltransferase
MSERPAFPVRRQTERLILKMLAADDAPRVVQFLEDNREHLRPWEPPLPPDFLTDAFFAKELPRVQSLYENDEAMRLFMLADEQPDSPVIGHVSFTQFKRGHLQSCVLSYACDYRRVGKGYMTEALRAGIAVVFDELGFHRIEATYQLENLASAAVLRKLEFTEVGTYPGYNFVNGAWRDNILVTKLNPSAPTPTKSGY